MTDNAFEIPQSVRDASEQNLKQAHAVYEQLTDFVTKAMDAWMGTLPANPMTIGFKDVHGQIMEFAKENADAAFTLAGKISNAPTLQDVLMLQTQFAQERLQTFVVQTQLVAFSLAVTKNRAPEVVKARRALTQYERCLLYAHTIAEKHQPPQQRL